MRTQFCIWLVNLLLEREVTRLEINEAWRKSYYYDSREISRNTFLEYKKRAEDLFDIDIVCDRRTNKYYIKAPELLKADPLKRWLLSSMAAVACIDQCKTLIETYYAGANLWWRAIPSCCYGSNCRLIYVLIYCINLSGMRSRIY